MSLGAPTVRAEGGAAREGPGGGVWWGNEEQLQSALRGANDGLWDWDLLTNRVEYSARWKGMLGYGDEELGNDLGTWMRLVDPAVRERVLELAAAFAEGRVPRFEVEFRMRHKGGDWVHVLSRAGLIRDGRGRAVRMVGTHIDITARCHAELLLEIQRDLAVELSRTQDLRAAWGALLASALRLPGFDCGGIYQRSVEDGSLELVAHHGLSEEFVRRARCHEAGSPQAELIGQGALLYALRPELPPEIGAALAVEGLEVLAVVPLLDGAEVIGALNVSSHRLPRIEAGSRVALESLAAQAAGGIARIRAEQDLRRLNETLEQRVRERTDEWLVANRSLQEVQARYRKLHESMVDAFVSVDLQGRITETNRSYQEMLGYSDAELRRLTYVDLTPERWHAMEERIVREQIYRRGWSDVYEKEYRRKDGTVFPVELRTLAIAGDDGEPTGCWAIVRDITERKAAEEEIRRLNERLGRRVRERTAELEAANRALRESEARFRKLAEAAFEGIAISEDGRLVDVNRQLAGMYGYEVEEMLGRPVLDFVAPVSRDTVARQIALNAEGSYEHVGLRKDGTEFPCEARARSVIRDGRWLRMSALRDLTEVKRAEAMVATQRLQMARFQRLAEVSEISMGVVHQLSQPLSAMANNLAVILGGTRDCCGDIHEAMSEVAADVRRARQTVTRLRALAHPERPLRVRFELNDLAARMVAFVSPEAEGRRIRVISEFGRGLPPVEVDEIQFQQVLLNLVRNAFDAVARCEAQRRVVTVLTREAGPAQVEILVRDLGCGILSDHLPRLFEPFFTTKPDGMGMGLRLAETIVAAHGGKVEGFNNEGPGATFRVVLPAQQEGVS